MGGAPNLSRQRLQEGELRGKAAASAELLQELGLEAASPAQAFCRVLPPSEISLNLSAQACLSVSSEITQH